MQVIGFGGQAAAIADVTAALAGRKLLGARVPITLQFVDPAA